MSAPLRFDDFVGIPFRDRGRDLTGCDCWGLFRLAFHTGTGIRLPSLDGDYAGRRDRARIGRLVAEGRDGPDWLPVALGAERPLDAALLAIKGTQHIGIIVRRGEFLHMPRDSFSRIEPLSRYAQALARGGLYRFAFLNPVSA